MKEERRSLHRRRSGCWVVRRCACPQLGVQDILVIDKQAKMGGCTRMAQGVFSIESPVQKRQGTRLSVDECSRSTWT